MEGKLIKLGLSEGYRLDDLNGNYIASTLNGKNKLSLRNCEEIELGFSLLELFDKVDRSIDYHEFDFASFRLGVKAVLELLGDKKFSEKDIRRALSAGLSIGYGRQFEIENKQVEIDSYIKSLQQTEWLVEIEMEESCPYDYTSRCTQGRCDCKKPKLDAGGCLILKIK